MTLTPRSPLLPGTQMMICLKQSTPRYPPLQPQLGLSFMYPELKYLYIYFLLSLSNQMETQSKHLEQVLSPPLSDMDQRQWTSRHLNAANIPNDQMALTPPYDNEHTHVNDVDVRGPDGLTPLMLASYRGNGLDNGCDNESSGSGSGESSNSGDSDDKSVEVIQALLVQGAEINAQTDRTG